MSSHREAPEISKDPVADNADVYAFVSPDRPDTVTIISNFVPLQNPAGGPNFYEFGDDVLYSIYIDNNGDGLPEISYVFNFKTTLQNKSTFLYNTGQITSLTSPAWNKRQHYSVMRVDGHDTTAYGTPRHFVPPPKHHKKHKHPHGHGIKLKTHVLGRGLACPPCNIGPRSTPNYEAALGAPAVHSLSGGIKVFAGQRQDGFYVDLGAIFDLGDLRPFQNLHLIPTAAAPGVDATATLNIHTIAIQIPISELTAHGTKPTDPTKPGAVIGVWSAASRRKVRMIDAANDERAESGPWVQVSRLGHPLINEVVIPLGQKDKWNTLYPAGDKRFLSHYATPELQKLLPVLYPGVFPHLAGITGPRVDLEAILLTGIPNGVVPGFPGNNGGKVLADQLRLNVAIPPASTPNRFGLLGGDIAGYPNGRRVSDDVVAIELRAIAGATYGLVNKSYTPDAAAGVIEQWAVSQHSTIPGPNRYLSTFPYLGTPLDGYDVP
jgi:Domain of unknown function (DUF4331)